MDLRIKEVCREKGISMTELSDRMNISKGALSQALNGNPTIGTIQKIADALGVTIVELFDAKTANRPDANAVSLLEYVLEFSEQRKRLGLTHKKYFVLYGHLKRYRGDVPLCQVNREYIDGFVEYLTTTTDKREKRQLSAGAVDAYRRDLITVLNSTINDSVKKIKTWIV